MLHKLKKNEILPAEGYLQETAHDFLRFQEIGDTRGQMVIIESNKNIPFAIKRIFYIYSSDSEVIRGQHANRRSEFVLVNVAGTSKVKVDDGTRKKVYVLDRPNIGIYIPKMVWKEMYDFSPDSVLLVLASELYDPEEYIRDYGQFQKEVEGFS